MGTLAEEETLGSSSAALAVTKTMVGLPRRPGHEQCVSLARASSALSMLTTAYQEGSLSIARCTRMSGTSTCITKCAPSWAATSDRTTATQVARLSSVLPTRNQVIYRGRGAGLNPAPCLALPCAVSGVQLHKLCKAAAADYLDSLAWR